MTFVSFGVALICFIQLKPTFSCDVDCFLVENITEPTGILESSGFSDLIHGNYCYNESYTSYILSGVDVHSFSYFSRLNISIKDDSQGYITIELTYLDLAAVNMYFGVAWTSYPPFSSDTNGDLFHCSHNTDAFFDYSYNSYENPNDTFWFFGRNELELDETDSATIGTFEFIDCVGGQFNCTTIAPVHNPSTVPTQQPSNIYVPTALPTQLPSQVLSVTSFIPTEQPIATTTDNDSGDVSYMPTQQPSIIMNTETTTMTVSETSGTGGTSYTSTVYMTSGSININTTIGTGTKGGSDGLSNGETVLLAFGVSIGGICCLLICLIIVYFGYKKDKSGNMTANDMVTVVDKRDQAATQEMITRDGLSTQQNMNSYDLSLEDIVKDLENGNENVSVVAASLPVSTNYQDWSQKEVILWMKNVLIKQNLDNQIIATFLREFGKQYVTGQTLVKFKESEKAFDGFKEQFSQKNQAYAIWLAIRDAIDQIGGS